MAMDCLMPYTLAGYDLMKPPGPGNSGGGVATKYARCASIPGGLNFRRITTVSEVDTDIVWADWLWFSPAYLGDEEDNKEQRIRDFLSLDVKFKGISATELNVCTWANNHRRMLINGVDDLKGVDCITHVNDYQKRMYQYCGIKNSKFLCDPINEYQFYPARKENRLVCMGQIGWHKRSRLVANLFKALKGSDIETCYLGGSKMWGNAKNAEYNQLHDEVEVVADTFVENATEAQCAYYVNTSKYYAHLAWHDVSPISQRENMMSGNVSFALTHPSMQEVTPNTYDTVEEMAEGIITYHSNPDPTRFTTDSLNAHTFAMKTNSYKAWREQMLKILGKEILL